MRGGKREGAGRPPDPDAKKPVTIHLRPSTLYKLKCLAFDRKMTVSQLIESVKWE